MPFIPIILIINHLLFSDHLRIGVHGQRMLDLDRISDYKKDNMHHIHGTQPASLDTLPKAEFILFKIER